MFHLFQGVESHDNWQVPGSHMGSSCLVILTQLLKCWLEVTLKYFQFFIALGMVWSRKNAIDVKLLEYVMHKLIFDFCSIVRQYIPGAHVNLQAVVNVNVNDNVDIFVRDWKSFQPIYEKIDNEKNVVVS